jgi:hypothetical protein
MRALTSLADFPNWYYTVSRNRPRHSSEGAGLKTGTTFGVGQKREATYAFGEADFRFASPGWPSKKMAVAPRSSERRLY